MAISKVVYGGDTLIDLTGDTVEEETLAEGATAHNARGEPITGKMHTTTVLYTEQTLTKAQKEQARKNIGITGTASVTDYGAKGDGTTDDTAAFQTALAENRVVFVPGGTYKLSGELVIRDNCQLELAQDAVLNFAQTSGNCITVHRSAWIKGNHATVNVLYGFAGNAINIDTGLHTALNDVQPWNKWSPMWKTARYIDNLNICKVDSNETHLGEHRSLDGTTSGTAVYISANKDAPNIEEKFKSSFIWGMVVSGLRIAGAFTYGIQAVNKDGAWNHEMRIEAYIDACKVGVSLKECNKAFLSVAVQPRKAGDESVYARHGVELIDSRDTDMTDSRIWDWDATNSLWTFDKSNVNQHIAMSGNCRGTILNDYVYYHLPGGFDDIRELIYCNPDSYKENNLATLVILQEPITRWFKPKDGEPYFSSSNGDKKLVLKEDLDAHFDTDKVISFTNVLPSAIGVDGNVLDGIGYMRTGGYWDYSGTNIVTIVNGSPPPYGCTGLIPCKPGDTVYVEGITLNLADSICHVNLYESAVTQYKFIMGFNTSNLNASNYHLTFVQDEANKKIAITVKSVSAVSKTAYMTLSFRNSDVTDPLVSVNEEIKYTYEGFLADGIKVKADNIVGLVNGGDSSGSGENTGTDEPIKELDVTLAPSEQLEVDSTIYSLQNLKKANTATIAFLTDLHTADANGGNETKIKKAITGYNAISSAVKTDLLLLGGDYMDNNPTTTKEKALGWYSNLRDVIDCRNSKTPMAVIKGNHDDNTMYTDYANGLVDIETFWEVFGDIDNERTVRDGGNIEDCYGYYDIPNKKIRVFYLNTVDIPQKFYEVLNKLNYRAQWDTGISINQLQFVADNLKFDDYGWRVMVFTHHPLMYNIAIENGCGVKADRGGTALLELLDKFNSGNTAGSISVTAQDFAGTVTYDFTDNKDCKIVACVNGHTHRDSVDVYNDSFFCISTRAVYGHPSYDGHISSSAYFVVDRNENKLHLVYNGDGEEKVFNYDSLTAGEPEESVEYVYEQIDSPYTFGINNLNYDTGEPVYDAKMFWVVSEEIGGFTKPALIDLSGYACAYRPVWFDAEGKFVVADGDWTGKDTPLEVPVGHTLRIHARNSNWSTWTEDTAATFTAAIKVYVVEGGESYIVGGSEPDVPDDPDVPESTTEEIASPFEWAIGQINDTTGESTSDSQNMRISSTEPVGFTTAATIDMSGYSAMYQPYWYDTDGNYIECGTSWISTSTPFTLPVDRTVRLKVRNNNYGVWTTTTINNFASAVKVTVDKGGESYVISNNGFPKIELGKAVKNVSYRIGAGPSGSEFEAYAHPRRIMTTMPYGEKPYKNSSVLWGSNAYPIPVPADATSITVVCPGFTYGTSFATYENDTYTIDGGIRWQSTEGGTYSFEAGAYDYVHIAYMNISGDTDIPKDTDTSGFSIVFN